MSFMKFVTIRFSYPMHQTKKIYYVVSAQVVPAHILLSE